MILHVSLVFFVTSLLLIQNGVVARKWNLSKQEDFELERQLNRLNKPAIKTIHTEHGDIYDCVDFYKQLAFDHPLLKNHTYNFEAQTVRMNNATQDQFLSDFIENMGLKDEECPDGTVIIKRVTKEDLIRKRFVSERELLAANENSYNVKRAIVRTLFTLDVYTGASARIGIYNPPVIGNQYSAARVSVQRANDAIQVGWRVDPVLNGDTKTHIFLRTDASGSDSHCFGTDCPGFVHTSKTISVNSYFKNAVSVKGGDNYYFQVDISRDMIGNWILRVGSGQVQLGYWPKEIFAEDGLANLAAYIEWGAEVFTTPDFPNTVMGFGTNPTKDTSNTAYIKKVAYKDSNYKPTDAKVSELFMDDDKYKVIDTDYTDDDDFRHTLFYGGPILQK